MSVTTTTDTARYTIHSVLADYDLYHSDNTEPAPPPSSHPAPVVQNPSDWNTQYRRVPRYRPTNYELESESPRQVFNNVPEQMFIRIMFLGVSTNAVSGTRLLSCRLIINGHYVGRVLHSGGEKRLED